MIADFDLTGQLVWPGAMLLNNYLSENPEMLRGRSVIELGSGVGKNLFELQSYFKFTCRGYPMHLTDQSILKALGITS